MADILEGKKGTKPAGLRQPGQFSTIVGPTARTNNAYNVEKQPKQAIAGKKND